MNDRLVIFKAHWKISWQEKEETLEKTVSKGVLST